MFCKCFGAPSTNSLPRSNVYNPREATIDYLLSNGQKKDRGKVGGFGAKKTVNVNYQDEHGRTCLHFAATVGDVSMIEDLLACSASPTIMEGRGQTALHYATMHNKAPGVVDLLVRCGAPLGLQDIHLNSPLHLAAMFGNIPAVRELVRHSVDITQVNSDGYTPMDVACLNGHSKIAGVLLQSHGNDILTMGTVSARHDKTSTTPLHLAARNGHGDTCLLLLRQGLNVNRESTAGTALHEAVLHGRLEVTQLLCEHGADITIKNVHGQTPLDVAQKFSAAHSADKLAMILSKFNNQESMVGQAMENCPAQAPTDLDMKCGELVHILSKNSDGRWHAFVTRGQTQTDGYIPWYKLELLSAHCKPINYMRASSHVLSERANSQFSSLGSLTTDHPAIPGNDRPHSVSVNGVSVSEQSARLLLHPGTILPYEDSQALMYEWLNNLGLSQYLSTLLDRGYDSPVLLIGITDLELDYIVVSDPTHRKTLLLAVNKLEEEIYTLKSAPYSVEDWLHAIGLGTYVPLLVGGGFEDFDIVVELTSALLIRLGMTKPGHRRKIISAIVGLKDWLDGHPQLEVSAVPNTSRPPKPARSISKNSCLSYSTESPPVSAGLRLHEDPICNSYWEEFVDTPPQTPSSEEILPVVEAELCSPIFAAVATTALRQSTNPFDTESENSDSDNEALMMEMTAQIKPKRTSRPSADGLSTVQRERAFTLEQKPGTSLDGLSLSADARDLRLVRGDKEEIGPLSPGETRWDSHEDMLGSGDIISGLPRHNTSYTDSTTSSDNLRVIKRGSSEHLDPISPPPKDFDDGLADESHDACDGGSVQDCVDLIRESSPIDNERNSLHLATHSPNGYYETDIFMISSDKENEIEPPNQPPKPMRRSQTAGVLQTNNTDDICRTCKLKEDPEIKQQKKSFLTKLEKRMSLSDAMKNINWESMSPEVAAVVKSVYNDDSNDIIMPQSKKVPPPVAPKPKFLKKANTVAKMETVKPVPVPDETPSNGVANESVSHNDGEAVKPPRTVSSSPSTPPSTPSSAKVTTVFDDLETMFDEFSKELDTFLT